MNADEQNEVTPELPVVEAGLSFIPAEHGGRARPFPPAILKTATYRPHVVLGDTNRREPIYEAIPSQEMRMSPSTEHCQVLFIKPNGSSVFICGLQRLPLLIGTRLPVASDQLPIAHLPDDPIYNHQSAINDHKLP
ncbi:MAG TPA: hypothetical protein VF784_14310 [Anaerolineales bacterium]